MRKSAAAAMAGALLVIGAQGAATAAFPNAGQITALIRARVKASRAHVEVLAVDVRARKFRLVVSVSDPAAYLKHRYERVVEAIFPRLERRVFRFTYLGVLSQVRARQVFAFRDAPAVGYGYVTSWRIDPKLLDCARALLLPDYEVDPDESAPACPAP